MGNEKRKCLSKVMVQAVMSLYDGAKSEGGICIFHI